MVNELGTRFVLETFSGLILFPTNLNQFCGFDVFKEGDAVAVAGEDMTVKSRSRNPRSRTQGSRNDRSRTQGSGDDSDLTRRINATNHGMIPVKILSIKQIWKTEIRKGTGRVSRMVDDHGITYHMFTEVCDPTRNNPHYTETENSLKFGPFVINYDICNVMGVADLHKTLIDLEGKYLSITYVDYGYEMESRDGTPIVILKYQVL
jgi:hypothetical protein